MKAKYIFLYHAIYWIYRVIHILAYVYFYFGESWYRGAYVVQLVLMPFFYVNYGLLIPALIEKKYKKFLLLTITWATTFVFVYLQWTVYQRNILYGEALRLPDYTETFNNLIYMWLISSSFCVFEFWMKNLKKNGQIALDRKKHLIKSEENKMLNQLLSENLTALGRETSEVLPDKIMLLSDFFKYILYNRDKVVSLSTELNHLRQYEILKNSKADCVRIALGILEENCFVLSSQIIVVVDRLVTALCEKDLVNIAIQTYNKKEVLITVSTPVDSHFKESLPNELPELRVHFEHDKCVVAVPTSKETNKASSYL